MMRNAIQITELIERQPQRGENLGIKLGQRLRRVRRDLFVQPRPPAKHAHHQLGGECVVAHRKFLVSHRVQQLGCIRILALDAQ